MTLIQVVTAPNDMVPPVGVSFREPQQEFQKKHLTKRWHLKYDSILDHIYDLKYDHK